MQENANEREGERENVNTMQVCEKFASEVIYGMIDVYKLISQHILLNTIELGGIFENLKFSCI